MADVTSLFVSPLILLETTVHNACTNKFGNLTLGLFVIYVEEDVKQKIVRIRGVP